MNDHTLQRLRTSRRYAWVGPGLAITCMVALVAWGLASQQPGLVVVASSARTRPGHSCNRQMAWPPRPAPEPVGPTLPG